MGARDPFGVVPRAILSVVQQTARAPSEPLPFWAAGGLSFAALATMDLATGAGPVSVSGLGSTWGLAMAAGLVQGAAWGGVARLARRRERGWLVWPALAVGAAVWLSSQLGVFSKLGGREGDLAAIALLLCCLAAAGLGLAAGLAQNTPRAPGWILRPPRSRRAVFAVGALACAATCIYMDRTQFVGLYPAAHLALRLASLWLAMLGLVVIWPARYRQLPRPGAVAAGLIALGLAWPLMALDEDERVTTQSILARPFPALALTGWRAVFDFDRDGYASVLGGGDCEGFDADIAPGAAEIPGNGIDDNCVLGDAVAVDLDFEAVEKPTTTAPTSVVLITVDALRADHLPFYGHSRDNAPNLQALAEESLVFDRAYSTGSTTSIAIPALHRGVYARRLRLTAFGLTNRERFVPPEDAGQLDDGEAYRWFYSLPRDDPRPSLAGWLKRRGMNTAAVVDDGGIAMLDVGPGTEDGFDEYTYVDSSLNSSYGDDREVADRALAALSALPSDAPFFLWVHFYGPHLPHVWHDEVPRFGDDAAAKYDHEIAFADLQIGRLLDAINERRGKQSIATVVTSDHGEIIDGDVRAHGTGLRDDSLHVPLLLQIPGGPTGRVAALASLVDVFPTVLGLTQTPAPPGLDGIDLLELHRAPRERTLVADLWRFNEHDRPEVDLCAAFDGRHRLVLNRKFNGLRLEEQDDDALQDLEAPHLERVLLGYLEETGGNVELRWTQ